MPDLGILITAKSCEVTAQNLAALRRSNPDLPIIELPFTVAKNEVDRKRFWAYADSVYYDWHAQRTIECARWLCLEWDTYVNTPLTEWLKPVWGASVASHSVQRQGSGWYWFRESHRLPKVMQPFAMGCMPLCGTMLSDKALGVIAKIVKEENVSAFSELRLGTVANYAGFTPEVNPNAKHMDWKEIPVSSVQGPGVYHAIKKLLADTTPLSCGCAGGNC